MPKVGKALLWVSQLIFVSTTYAMQCSRIPPELTSDSAPVNGQYLIDLTGNPHSYTPGQKYKVTLRSADGNDQNRFISFVLLVENRDVGNGNMDAGNLQLLGDALTTFHDKCPNAVTQTNSIPKNEIQVLWIAPPPGSGCVVFRGTIIVSRDIWFNDDGTLSLTLCEDSEDIENIEPPILQTCCACHEAKYEVTFESLWSRNTHPKDFPPNNFITKFSDIIGATHSVDYKFWDYGEPASDGVKELAEQGNTKLLETELKEKSDHIRTIIKARGISYPNITGKTFAVFRVDDRHHLMSLISMIHPSPDWIVGVSSLELCQQNCSWVESKTLNLFPWDAGTDSGSTYLAEDSPIFPREPIKKITTVSPANSPFYDDSGVEMKPLARLILSRQRLYEKHNCIGPSKESPNFEEYCAVTDWQAWSPCNVDCGRGTKHRQRTYKLKVVDQHKQKETCKQTLTQRSSCYAAQPECRTDTTTTGEECQLTPWGKWSECSVTCGNGTRTKSRRYKTRPAAKQCQQLTGNPPRLEQNLPCEMPPCDWPQSTPVECADRAWSEWSTCSVSCGKGTKMRRKLSIRIQDLHKHNRISRSFQEQDGPMDSGNNCENVIERVECYNDEAPSCDETTTVSENSVGETRDCVVSKWTHWSACSVSCGKGIKTKTRKILQPAGEGGKPCPEKLKKKKKCRVACTADVDADCQVSDWSSWSPCNHTCGPNSVRQRTRNILQQPSGNGEACPERVDIQPCNLSVCPDY